MQAFRICRRPFADLSGEGARRHGGRWNSPGAPLVYMAETAALAVLEVRVHLDLPWELLPADYVLLEIETGAVDVERHAVIPHDPRSVGDAWLRSRRSALLRVPSILVPESANLLLNPDHPDASLVSVTGVRPFAFDRRLWT